MMWCKGKADLGILTFLAWESGGHCPSLLTQFSLRATLPQRSHQLFYDFATAPGFGRPSSTLVFLLRLCELLRILSHWY